MQSRERLVYGTRLTNQLMKTSAMDQFRNAHSSASRSLVALFAAACVTPALAECEKEETFGKAIACLERKLTALQAAQAVPAGAVLAFRDDCPTGWQRLDEAEGRFVVGAGNAHRPLTTGGRPAILFEYLGEGRYGRSGGDATYRPPGPHATASLMVDTMPPYIALRICVK